MFKTSTGYQVTLGLNRDQKSARLVKKLLLTRAVQWRLLSPGFDQCYPGFKPMTSPCLVQGQFKKIENDFLDVFFSKLTPCMGPLR